jgi:hypothetical protein
MPRLPKPDSSKPTTTRPRVRKKKDEAAQTTPLRHDEIARRAYDLFVRDGAVHGRDMDHWLIAERQLLTEPPGAGR